MYVKDKGGPYKKTNPDSNGQSKLNKPKEVTPQIGNIGIPPKR